METARTSLRSLVKGFYDLQELRIQAGGRLVANFKVKLGQKPGEKEKTLDDEASGLLTLLRTTYQKMTDAVPLTARTFKAKGIISDFVEYALVHLYLRLQEEEKRSGQAINSVVQKEPLWISFLSDVKGCGPQLAAIIMSEIDISVSKYPSSLWAYAGYDVLQVPVDPKDPTGETQGEGRNRQAHHLVERDYTDKKGKPAVRMGITFNPFLKTKLYLLGTSFLRSGMPCTGDCKKPSCIKRGAHTSEYGSPYGKIYADYRHRLENNPRHDSKSKGHRHNMAIRYMIKQFLVDLYNEWRALEKLPIAPTYSEAKLGMQHGVTS